jgi:hypothetical protein
MGQVRCDNFQFRKKMDPYAISSEKSYCAFFILKALFALEYIRQFFCNTSKMIGLYSSAASRGGSSRPDLKKFVAFTGGPAAASIPEARQV